MRDRFTGSARKGAGRVLPGGGGIGDSGSKVEVATTSCRLLELPPLQVNTHNEAGVGPMGPARRLTTKRLLHSGTDNLDLPRSAKEHTMLTL